MNSFFWDRIAERYSKHPVADESAYQHKLTVTREHFRADMDVLEFGCGTGTTAIAHAPYVSHIQAIDISPKMLEIAQGKARAENIENVTFEQSTLDEIRVPDQSFDAVLGLSVLHLLKSKEQAVRKVHKLLKPGGVFVSSTVCIADSMSYFKFIAPLGRPFGLVLKVFTREELEDCISAAGFETSYSWRAQGDGKSVFIVAKKRTQ